MSFFNWRAKSKTVSIPKYYVTIPVDDEISIRVTVSTPFGKASAVESAVEYTYTTHPELAGMDFQNIDVEEVEASA